MCPHSNNILPRGGRTHRMGSISVSRIPRRDQYQKVLVVVHVLIEIPCLGSVGINLRSPGGAVDIGLGAAGFEELGIEGEVERAFTVANVGEGDFRSGSNAVGHAFAIEPLPGDGSGNVRTVSVLVVALVLERLVLDNFSGSCIQKFTRITVRIVKITIVPITSRITNRHHLPIAIQPNIKKRSPPLHLALRQPLHHRILNLDPLPTFQRAHVRMRRNGKTQREHASHIHVGIPRDVEFDIEQRNVLLRIGIGALHFPREAIAVYLDAFFGL
mmetsp:Transcript_24965/g.45153  ORF Transcript_24965/g.45153 Transcript_24965/m.45153 type:complete len:272 (-) Transcript_24965:834-1649(-)